MTDTIEIADASSRPSRGLSGLNVAELKGMASGLGITGTGRMRKDELVAAIAARRSGGPGGTQQGNQDRARPASNGDRRRRLGHRARAGAPGKRLARVRA